VHALVHTDIGKHRFDNAQASGVDPLALFGIDLGLHLLDDVRLLPIHLDGEIPAGGGRFAQTLRSQRAGGAIFFAGVVNIIGAIAVGLVAGMTGQFFSVRTEIHLLGGIEREGRRSEETWLSSGSLPAVDAILEALLLGKALISFAELDVGDVRIDLFIFADRQTLE